MTAGALGALERVNNELDAAHIQRDIPADRRVRLLVRERDDLVAAVIGGARLIPRTADGICDCCGSHGWVLAFGVGRRGPGVLVPCWQCVAGVPAPPGSLVIPLHPRRKDIG